MMKCFSFLIALILSALSFSCQTTKGKFVPPPKTTLKVYKTPSNLPAECENLPSFDYSQDSTEIYYESVIKVENTNGILKKIKSVQNIQNNKYRITLDSLKNKKSLIRTGQYHHYLSERPNEERRLIVRGIGNYYSPPFVGCNFSLTVSENKVTILVKSPSYSPSSNIYYVNNGIELMRANLYHPGKEKSEIKDECYLLIQIDQAIKILMAELTSQIKSASN